MQPSHSEQAADLQCAAQHHAQAGAVHRTEVRKDNTQHWPRQLQPPVHRELCRAKLAEAKLADKATHCTEARQLGCLSGHHQGPGWAL